MSGPISPAWTRQTPIRATGILLNCQLAIGIVVINICNSEREQGNVRERAPIRSVNIDEQNVPDNLKVHDFLNARIINY